MKLPQYILIILFSFATVITVLFFTEEEGSFQHTHPVYPTMQIGQTTTLTETFFPELSAAFGFCTLLIFVLTHLFGYHSKPIHAKEIRQWHFVAGLAYMLSFLALIIAYWNHSPVNDSLVLGFPLPTSIMLYLLGLAPLIFTFCTLSSLKPGHIPMRTSKHFGN